MIKVLYGPPGAGKTTLAHSMMQRGDILLDLDELFKAVAPKDNPLFKQAPAFDLAWGLMMRGIQFARATDSARVYVVTTMAPADLCRVAAVRDFDDAEILVVATKRAECERRVGHLPNAGELRTAIRRWWEQYEAKPGWVEVAR